MQVHVYAVRIPPSEARKNPGTYYVRAAMQFWCPLYGPTALQEAIPLSATRNTKRRFKVDPVADERWPTKFYHPPSLPILPAEPLYNCVCTPNGGGITAVTFLQRGSLTPAVSLWRIANS